MLAQRNQTPTWSDLCLPLWPNSPPGPHLDGMCSGLTGAGPFPLVSFQLTKEWGTWMRTRAVRGHIMCRKFPRGEKLSCVLNGFQISWYLFMLVKNLILEPTSILKHKVCSAWNFPGMQLRCNSGNITLACLWNVTMSCSPFWKRTSPRAMLVWCLSCWHKVHTLS